MRHTYDIFVDGIRRTRDISVVYDHLVGKIGMPPSEVGDLLRAQIVYSVSALDRLIHELVRIGVLEIFNNRRIPTAKFHGQPFKAITLIKALKYTAPDYIPQDPSESAEALINEEMTKILGYQAFQAPDKVKDALSYIWNEPHKMQVIASKMGLSAVSGSSAEEQVVQTLKLITDRRNQIAHEADYDSAQGCRREINKSVTDQSILFIEKFGTAVYELVTDSSCYLSPSSTV